MKRNIKIYLAGVILAWFLGVNNMYNFRKSINGHLTYGDVTFVTLLSLTSWCSVLSFTIIELADSDILDKPVRGVV